MLLPKLGLMLHRAAEFPIETGIRLAQYDKETMPVSIKDSLKDGFAAFFL
jgi:hypothetical protein